MSETAPTVMILSRRRGRPPKSDNPGSTLSVWITEREHDQLAKMALAHEVSVSRLVRSLLTRAALGRRRG